MTQFRSFVMLAIHHGLSHMRVVLRTTLLRAAVALIIPICASTGTAQQGPDSTARKTQRSLDSLTVALRELRARLDSMTRATGAAPAAQPAASGSYMNMSFDGLGDIGWSSVRNIRSIERGDHDPRVRGFSIPNAEIALDGTIDPYFKGFSNIVLKLNENGETGVELEEMYLVSTSLPHNLQIKAGQFFTEFGRQNPQHPHAWAFVDQPLVLSRMFGPEGLRSQGARLSWLLPTKFYSEALLTVANSAGGTTHSFRSEESSVIHGGVPIDRGVNGIRDLLIAPRLAASFDPTSTQTLLVGASAALGPNNSGPRANTRIAGADVYWKWKSARARQGFPFVSLQTEALVRQYEAAPRTSATDEALTLVGSTLRDRGVYSQLLWGIKPLLVLGLRADFANGDEGALTTAPDADRYRVSPNVTWYPSEYSKLRLQYNYGRRPGFGADHSLWMQYEFLLGSHSAHKF